MGGWLPSASQLIVVLAFHFHLPDPSLLPRGLGMRKMVLVSSQGRRRVKMTSAEPAGGKMYSLRPKLRSLGAADFAGL